ncbi:MAG: hypothetical protein QOG60_1149, partial [Frankiaceae bacterium]|nr:hypothetical protein [Frankiaceae bacterium]
LKLGDHTLKTSPTPGSRHQAGADQHHTLSGREQIALGRRVR